MLLCCSQQHADHADNVVVKCSHVLKYVVRSQNLDPNRVGFKGGLGHMSRIYVSEEELSHPPGFSNYKNDNSDGKKRILEGSFSNFNIQE